MYTANDKPIEKPEGKGTDASVGWGAALIDEQGNEVPITESMIARACDELALSWCFPRNSPALAR